MDDAILQRQINIGGALVECCFAPHPGTHPETLRKLAVLLASVVRSDTVPVRVVRSDEAACKKRFARGSAEFRIAKVGRVVGIDAIGIEQQCASNRPGVDPLEGTERGDARFLPVPLRACMQRFFRHSMIVTSSSIPRLSA
jgi:hypothetical protein